MAATPPHNNNAKAPPEQKEHIRRSGLVAVRRARKNHATHQRAARLVAGPAACGATLVLLLYTMAAPAAGADLRGATPPHPILDVMYNVANAITVGAENLAAHMTQLLYGEVVASSRPVATTIATPGGVAGSVETRGESPARHTPHDRTGGVAAHEIPSFLGGVAPLPDSPAAAPHVSGSGSACEFDTPGYVIASPPDTPRAGGSILMYGAEPADTTPDTAGYDQTRNNVEYGPVGLEFNMDWISHVPDPKCITYDAFGHRLDVLDQTTWASLTSADTGTLKSFNATITCTGPARITSVTPAVNAPLFSHNYMIMTSGSFMVTFPFVAVNIPLVPSSGALPLTVTGGVVSLAGQIMTSGMLVAIKYDTVTGGFCRQVA